MLINMNWSKNLEHRKYIAAFLLNNHMLLLFFPQKKLKVICSLGFIASVMDSAAISIEVPHWNVSEYNVLPAFE